ncbi:MAG: thiamine pyrophosphate-binding protein [Thermomicrobiales bacterium]
MAIETRERAAVAGADDGVQPAKSMTGGQALIASLIENGVDTIFALPGVQLDPAFDALYDLTDQINVIHPRHEQAAAYMADGYARTTGKTGVCLVVPGPGLLNATAALSTAYACNSPVLCVTGQIQSDLIEFGRGLLHEIPNQLGMVRSVTKHAERAIAPDAIPGLVDRALEELYDGRVRPVEIEVPPDTLYAVNEVQLLPPADKPARFAGDPALIAEAAALLAGAQKPLIWSGGGVLGAEAWDELREVAAILQAPVVMTSNGKGAVSDRDPLAQNILAGVELVKDADVIFAVGTRFVDPSTSVWKLEEGRTVIQLDIDAEEVGRNYPVTVGIQADAKAGLAALAEELKRLGVEKPSRAEELTALKEAVMARAIAVGPQAEYAMAIREALPDDGIVLSEMTQVGYWSNMAFPVYEPRSYITPGYQGTLGWGFPTALGVKVAHPDRPVVSINGDGGFGFCLNELSTMAKHDIAAIIIVFTDDAFGNVQRIQRELFNGRTIASDLLNPDFMKLAEAFGVTGRTATTPAELKDEITASIEANEPTLIAVPIGKVPNPWTALGLR